MATILALVVLIDDVFFIINFLVFLMLSKKIASARLAYKLPILAELSER